MCAGASAIYIYRFVSIPAAYIYKLNSLHAKVIQLLSEKDVPLFAEVYIQYLNLPLVRGSYQ